MYDLSCTSNHPLEGSLLDFLKQLFFFICKKLVVILFLSKPNFIHVNLLLLHMPCLLPYIFKIRTLQIKVKASYKIHKTK